MYHRSGSTMKMDFFYTDNEINTVSKLNRSLEFYLLVVILNVMGLVVILILIVQE